MSEKIKMMSSRWKVAGIAVLALAMVFGMSAAVLAESPAGCNGDDSFVNISTDKNVAKVGDVITFSVSAGNPAGTGCDIEDRTLTLTLPDGTIVASGPANYPRPTASAVIISEPYVADASDLSGGTWTANVSWNGTLKAISDLDSSGSKNISVNEIESLDISKTAIPESTIEYEWSIDKSVTPDVWSIFAGDSGTSEYTIELVKSVLSESHSVSGTVTITNPNDVETVTITGVTDVISGYGAPDSFVCDESFPFDLAPGATTECDYSSSLPDTSARTNTATVTTSQVGNSAVIQGFDFVQVVPELINDSVNVDDTFDAGDNGPFSSSTSYTYTRQFVCGVGEGEYEGTGNVVPNTAEIVETGDSDNASVTVNCYDLSVEKTAETTYDREFNWSIVKVGDQEQLLLAQGQPFLVNYDVTVDVSGDPVDSNHMVSGEITVTNNHPTQAADLVSVTDELSIDGAVAVDCGGVTVVPAADSIVCSYSSSLASGAAQTNTATATQQNYDYDEEGAPTAGGTTAYEGSADVTFGAPANLIDECIVVNDTHPEGPQGEVVCVDDAPVTFEYAVEVGPYDETACGVPQFVDNTASYTSQDDDNDTGETGSDDWTVEIEVACELGCTLTQGYWKTHSSYGPAPYDDNWESLVSGADTIFYLSGDTWYNVFWTSPKGGNAYYQLAHQYMAAWLNVANGASTTTEVDDAMTYADAFFSTYTPTDLIDLSLKGKAKKVNQELNKEASSFASVLASYNEGDIGPGHCDEDETSEPPLVQ